MKRAHFPEWGMRPFFLIVIFKFGKHNRFQPCNVGENDLFSTGMKLADFFHVCTDSFVNRMFNWNRVIISGMYMIQIAFRDRKHIL